MIWGSIAAALTGLCGVIFLAVTAHFFIKQGFSYQSLNIFFIDGKKKELLSWIALFIENYPMVKNLLIFNFHWTKLRHACKFIFYSLAWTKWFSDTFWISRRRIIVRIYSHRSKLWFKCILVCDFMVVNYKKSCRFWGKK